MLLLTAANDTAGAACVVPVAFMVAVVLMVLPFARSYFVGCWHEHDFG